MRHIKPEDIDAIDLPEGWSQTVAAANAAVARFASATRADRNQAIASHGDSTWGQVKAKLSGLNSGKCWYCDCRQDRSDNNVDHFRPKGKVFGCPTHPGYWWLAFDLQNFRYSCTFCNSRRKDDETETSGGKQDNFPVAGTYRAMSPTDSWQAEEPLLLDPINDRDIGLLTWKLDGQADARFAREQNERWWQRASISVEAYHLNHYKLTKRRKKLYNAIKLRIADGDLYYAKLLTGESTAEHALGRVMGYLYRRQLPNAECCEVAKQYIREFRDITTRPWLDALS